MTTINRNRGLTEQAAETAVDSACRMLRLPTVRAKFPELAEAAVRDQMTYRGFLAELLMAECDDRNRRRSERRIKAAAFPRQKTLREFDFDANPGIDPATVHTLASSEWVKKGEPLCLIGDSGTGKSHLLIALGTEAAMAGYRVKYTLATKLVNELVEAADDKQLNKTITRYGRVDLLCIDELGYMGTPSRGAELLFQVLTEREEKNSLAIASNEAFSGWAKTFTDPRLCAAIVDRLTFGGTIIETGTDSYRLAQTRARDQAAGRPHRPRHFLPQQACTRRPEATKPRTGALTDHGWDAGMAVGDLAGHSVRGRTALAVGARCAQVRQVGFGGRPRRTDGHVLRLETPGAGTTRDRVHAP
ncbi:IS21-like element helper ATPase IstB [Actinomadura sp. CNU-125]|uniref:IS21-like element helper ATPase IstB n=1 Tax=Actinomadura sp. CNU-125 TaxID=1904961 RepID=UPI000AF04C1C|nr:IS21-like element helper ATPase IstB [Actinomadura sp. CNU-125]